MLDGCSCEIIGVILAGGKSSRMGQDKACLEVNGETMLLRNKNLLKRVGVSKVLVCGGQHSCIEDIYPGIGPMAGIHSALEHFKTYRKSYDKTQFKALLIIPVDMPLLNEQILKEIILCGASLQSALRYKDSPLPLLLPITEENFVSAQRVVKGEGKHSITRFLNFINCSSITTTDQQAFMNTNDYKTWLKAQQLIERGQFHHGTP